MLYRWVLVIAVVCSVAAGCGPKTETVTSGKNENRQVVGTWTWQGSMGSARVVLNADGTGSISGGPDANFKWQSQGKDGFTAIVDWNDGSGMKKSRFFGTVSSDGQKIETNWSIWGFEKNISSTFERF